MKLFPVFLFVQTLPYFCKEILFSSLKEKLSAVLSVVMIIKPEFMSLSVVIYSPNF